MQDIFHLKIQFEYLVDITYTLIEAVLLRTSNIGKSMFSPSKTK